MEERLEKMLEEKLTVNVKNQCDFGGYLQSKIRVFILANSTENELKKIAEGKKALNDCMLYCFDYVKKQYMSIYGSANGGASGSDEWLCGLAKHYFDEDEIKPFTDTTEKKKSDTKDTKKTTDKKPDTTETKKTDKKKDNKRTTAELDDFGLFDTEIEDTDTTEEDNDDLDLFNFM